jgi:hypothetical protein
MNGIEAASVVARNMKNQIKTILLLRRLRGMTFARYAA